MDITYLVTPFFAWFLAGSLKFSINSIKAKQLAFGQIGYGGLPSNHSAIVSSMAALIAIREGIASPIFGVALTLAFIVMLDAASLRTHIGKHATVINQLIRGTSEQTALRERVGHTRIEIFAGVFVGIFTAWFTDGIYNLLID